MNERIKQLAEQAGWMMGDEVEGFNIRLEKFAELMVRECVEQIKKWTPSKFENDFEEGAIWAFEESVIRIKEHFGIDNESLPYTVTYRS